MGYAALKKHAQGLPGATWGIQWQEDWVAKVGGKMFFVGGPEPGPWRACSFKVDEHRFLELTGLSGVAPAPYLARARWVQVRDAKALPATELRALVTRSHALVLATLPRKLQKEIGA